MSANEKQYGLVEVKTGKKITVSDVFKNTSDSEEDVDNPMKRINQQKDEKELKKQVKLEMQKALQDDPTVYQYDEIYDEMTLKKQETELMKKNPEKKPKYIHNLMKTAERRKKENERRLERQIQKEREAEGDMFKDKEEFITSSYKQKLEEFKLAEEEDRKMEYIESIMDVSKQQDLGGFYRHLYKEIVSDTGPINEKEIDDKKLQELNSKKFQDQETVTQQDNYSKILNSGSVEIEKKSEPNPTSSSSDSDTSSNSSSTSSSSDAEDKTDGKKPEGKPCQLKSQPKVEEKAESHDKIKKDQEDKSTSKIFKSTNDNKYESKDERARNGSKYAKMDEKERKERNSRSTYDKGSRNQGRRDDRSFRDRDRREDFKIRDRRDRRSNDSKRRRSRTPENRRRRRSKSRERSAERSRSRRGYERGNREERETRSHFEPKKNEVKIVRKEELVMKKETSETQKEIEVEHPKVSIWEKRTTGEVFTAALERYKQRKATRGS